MTDGELHGRPRASKDTYNEQLVGAKTVEALGIRIGLHRGRKVAGQGRSKIAKTGRSDEPISAPGERPGHLDSLTKAAGGAVDDQHLHALAHHGVFQGAERSLDRRAATGEAGPGACQVTRKDCVDASGGNNEDCEHERPESAMTL